MATVDLNDRWARITEGKIQLFSPYDQEMVDDIRKRNRNMRLRPPGTDLVWAWCAAAGCWECPDIPENRELIDEPLYAFDIEGDGPEFDENPMDKPWLKLDLGKIMGANGLPPWDFQYECLQFLMWRHGRGFLGLDMALGKSIIAALFCKMKRAHMPSIIICPSTLKLQWAKYWGEWVGAPVTILSGRKGRPLERGMTYIINWDILGYRKEEKKQIMKHGREVTQTVKVVQKDSWFYFIKQAGFKTTIADEIQYCNNVDTVRGKALKEIAQAIPNFIPLSGTPIKTKPSQFWLPLHLCDDSRFPKLSTFKRKFCKLEHTGYGEKELPGCKDPKVLHNAIKNVMIRFRKEDVLKDLPLKTRVIVPMEIDTAEWKKRVALFKEETKGLDRTKAIAIEAAIKTLMSSAFDVKKDSVMAWLDEFKEMNPGKKLVIFAWHRAVVEYIHEYYKKESVLYYGGMSNPQKVKSFETFLNDPHCIFFVGNAQSAGTGLDGMQHVCNTTVFIEITQSPADSDQAEDRVVRPGQLNPVTCFYLPADNTIDMDIMENWDLKREMIDQIVEGKETSDCDDLLSALFLKYAGPMQNSKAGLF
jgi:SWI/SNF-related matrix-associated actin-dependent regulator 1 of chromatin subfamily A